MPRKDQFNWGKRPCRAYMTYMPVAMKEAWASHEFKRRVLELLEQFLAEKQA